MRGDAMDWAQSEIRIHAWSDAVTVYQDDRFVVNVSGTNIRKWVVADTKQRRAWTTDVFVGENTTWWMLFRLWLLLRKVKDGGHLIDRAARMCARHFLMDSPHLEAARKEVDDIAPEST